MTATRLDRDWRPNDDELAKARARRPDLDIEEAIEMFRDYWCALRDTPAAKKLDWDATFRNYIRSPISNQARPQGAAKPKATTPSPAQPAVRRSPEERASNLQRLGEMMAGMFKGAKA